MTTAKLDGCPRCTRRGNAPRTWDETTGHGTYRCRCGHSWETWWETPAAVPRVEPADFGSLLEELLGEEPA